MRKILNALLWVALLSLLVPPSVMAQEGVVCETDYVVQPGDWLKKIATQHYGNPDAYLDIVEATNAKAAEDASYAVIANPNIIQSGWKLCLPSGETSPPVTPQPPTATQYQLGLTLASETLPPDTMSQARLFPLSGAPDFFIGPVQAFLEPPVSSGSVRLALARPVPNLFSPGEFIPSQTTGWSWVLLTPNSDEASALAWQEIKIDPSAEAAPEALSIERAISETIVLDADVSSEEALIEALDARANVETGAGLWVDFLLMEETDAQGAKTWTLYNLAIEDVPSGEDEGTIGCCRWWGCGSGSSGFCPFWCAGVCP